MSSLCAFGNPPVVFAVAIPLYGPRCALKFEGILKVKSKKINQKNKKKRLECLAIECNEILNNNNEINFFFAGGSIITLISESIEVVLNDLGESWNVKYIPKHKI